MSQILTTYVNMYMEEHCQGFITAYGLSQKVHRTQSSNQYSSTVWVEERTLSVGHIHLQKFLKTVNIVMYNPLKTIIAVSFKYSFFSYFYLLF